MFSSSALRTYGVVTLPSVESINVVRDPPKSIHTRRIIRVGDDLSGEEYGDIARVQQRTADSIMKFARGINPIRGAIGYSNTTQPIGLVGQASAGLGKLPRRIMSYNGPQFRPPKHALSAQRRIPMQPIIPAHCKVNPTATYYFSQLDDLAKQDFSNFLNETVLKSSVDSRIQLPYEVIVSNDPNVQSRVHSNPITRRDVHAHKSIRRETTDEMDAQQQIRDSVLNVSANAMPTSIQYIVQDDPIVENTFIRDYVPLYDVSAPKNHVFIPNFNDDERLFDAYIQDQPIISVVSNTSQPLFVKTNDLDQEMLRYVRDNSVQCENIMAPKTMVREIDSLSSTKPQYQINSNPILIKNIDANRIGSKDDGHRQDSQQIRLKDVNHIPAQSSRTGEYIKQIHMHQDPVLQRRIAVNASTNKTKKDKQMGLENTNCDIRLRDKIVSAGSFENVGSKPDVLNPKLNLEPHSKPKRRPHVTGRDPNL